MQVREKQAVTWELNQQMERCSLLLERRVLPLQIVPSNEVLTAGWFDRSLLEPMLGQQADGAWVLTVRQQGEYHHFEIPYMRSDVLLLDPEDGLVVVLVSYHGNQPQKYGRLGYLIQKGQFYRYYQRQPDGTWQRVEWRAFPDEVRTRVLAAVQEQGPTWARIPGKLRHERNPPTKRVALTSYKVVRLIEGRYASLYDPTRTYVLGQRVKEPARPKHGGGFYSYPSREQAIAYLTECVSCLPFHPEVATPTLALLECAVSGHLISYEDKIASTFLRPLRVLEIREVQQKVASEESVEEPIEQTT